jgi:pimeloyl-ACP methyl ester carboxylesterase
MRLFFQKMGQGPALIILHGLYGLSDNWLTIGRRLSERFTVYLVDQRNHGRSPHAASHTYQDMADDLNELLESENLPQSIILGHSMGGKTAMLFAAQKPHKVAALVVVDIAPVGYTSVSEHSEHSIFHLNVINSMLSIDPSAKSTRSEIEAKLSQTIKDVSVRQFIMKNITRNTSGLFEWKLNVKALSKNLPAILGDLALEKNIPCGVNNFPSLFIAGANSDYITAQNQELIMRFFPRTSIVTIPNAGHWVHAEQPELFVTTVVDFLK